MSKRNVVLASLAVTGIVLAGLSAVFARSTWSPSHTFEAQLASIQECMGRVEAISCVRPIVKEVLQKKSVVELIDALATHLPVMRCHYVIHVVGQELYRARGDVEKALAECSRKCDTACVHGVAGEAFAEKLGLGSPDDEEDFDLEHLNADEVSSIGRSLCTSSNACHGVGHILFLTTKKLTQAMSICSTIATSATSSTCYTGAAMEYADILETRNMRYVSGVAYPTDDEISTLCDLPLLAERRACYRSFQRIVIETLTTRGLSQTQAMDRVRQHCESIPSDLDRSACFFGYGRFNSYWIESDPAAAVRWCNHLSSERDQASCYFGEVNLVVVERQKQLVGYCKKLRSVSLQSACYQELSHALYGEEASGEDVAKFCDSNNAVCEQGLKRAAADPWEEIQNNFQT